jgi:hypothetical protein
MPAFYYANPLFLIGIWFFIYAFLIYVHLPRKQLRRKIRAGCISFYAVYVGNQSDTTVVRECLHCNAQCSDCGGNDLNTSADRTSPGVKPARYSVVTNSLTGRNLTTWHLKSTCSLDLVVLFGLHKFIVCSKVRPLPSQKFIDVSEKPATPPSCTLRRWRQHIENLYHISQHRIADNRMPHCHRSNRLTT